MRLQRPSSPLVVAPSQVWDGLTDDGVPVADGTYRIQATVTDKAGTQTTEPGGITIT